jgi:hypothetical protein
VQHLSFHLNSFKFAAVLFLASACVTAPTPSLQDAIGGQKDSTPTPNASGQNQTPGSDTTGPRSALGDAVTKTILSQIKAVEIAYANGKCDEIATRAQALRGVLTEDLAASAPLSFFIALSDCAAKNAPLDNAQVNKSLDYLDLALSSLSPTWDRSRLLKMKASRLEASGKLDLALKTRLQLAAALRESNNEKLANDADLVRLDPDFQTLTPLEREKIKDILASYLREDRLFDTLRMIDTAASGGAEAKPALSSVLRKTRDQVLLRIEEVFAADIALIVAMLQSGQRPQAESAAQSLKRKYPTLNYQRRIDATLAAFANPTQDGQTMPLSGGLGALPDTSDLSPEQRMRQATEALDSGRPDHAVALLRAIPEQSRSTAASKLLAESENVHIRNLRLRVTDLFKSAESKSNPQDKILDYDQALELLNYILREYPKNPARRQIEKNIRSIETTLRQLRGLKK